MGRQSRSNRPPPVPSSFQCHVCEGNHWTVHCPRVLRDPHKYPRVHENGCYQCGRFGHRGKTCTVRRYRCNDCGGMHDTKECIYLYKPKQWHEFYDPIHQKVFYVNVETNVPQWAVPYHLDIVLWHCDRCKLLIPDDQDRINECVQCHDARPKSIYTEEDYLDSDEEGEGVSGDATATPA